MKSLAVLLAALLLAAFAGAQDTAFSQQEKARNEFDKLTEAMQHLQLALAETAPDESKVLGAGNRYVQEQRLRDRMTQVRELLMASSWDEALEQMTSVRRDLDVLMQLLLSRDMDLEQLLAEIQRLEEFKQRVEGVLADQRAEKQDATRSEALQRQLDDIERAKADVERLLEQQKNLREQTNQTGLRAGAAAAAQLAGRQGELETDAKKLAERAAQLEQRQRELQDKKAGGSQPPSGQPQSSSGGACSGACQGAAGAMDQAQQQLQQNAAERSLEDMDQALRKLEDAVQALAAMADAARRELLQLPFEQQAAKQEVTRVATDKLAADMEKSGADSKSDQKDTPGTTNVQQAVPKQKAAAGMLKEYKPGKAKQPQQDAVEDLEAAQRKLEDALAQLRQQLHDQVLRALEERFGAMLAAQKELSAGTVAAEHLRTESLTANGGLPAAIVARCAELASGESALASEAHDALTLIGDEGTTVVFPDIVVELQGDLERVAARLGQQQDTGVTTQAMQTEIEETLKMLLDALRRSIEAGEGQGGQCNGEPPLVPMSAELKLILNLQKRVAKRTTEFDNSTPANDRATAAGQTAADELARKQGRVTELTRKLAVKQAKESQAVEGR